MFDNDKIREVAVTIAYNQIMSSFEPAYSYSHRGMRDFISRTRQDFSYSIDKQAHFIPGLEVDVDDLLIVFEEFTRDSDREYMMMAIGDPTAKGFASVALERGSAVSVGWPRAGIDNLKRRTASGLRSRVVAAHNHPRGLLHDLLSLLNLDLPGASGRDRDVTFQWMLQSLRSNIIVPEFYLVENRHFRRILAPSWPRLMSLLRPLLTR